MTYTRHIPHISLADALAEPEADSLFIEPSGQPKITIQTTLEIEGHTLNITFNDTSISDALAILRRQARPAPAPTQPRQRRRRTRPAEPRYEPLWLDLDDEPTERGTTIVSQATQLLNAGAAPCWSTALATVRKYTK